MHNVRIIEYPDSFQVRLYERPIDFDFSEMSLNDCPADFPEKMIENVFYKLPKDFDFDDLEDYETKKERKKNESIRTSLSRTKSNLYYIARSNIWQYFLTLTISSDNVNSRYDYVECSKKVRKFLNNVKSRKSPNMFYLIVPEMHKDGAWHFHGLIGGCDGLSFADSGKKDNKGRVIYNWSDYNIGFSTATECTHSGKASNYITKYITKSLIGLTKGHQRYYVSNNVKKAEISDYFVADRQEFIYQLYEKMSFCKTVEGYNKTLYFEIPKKGE